ncbi:hypothetical protein SERLA73DRAFT_78080 [Serpula lacrymans var. lacrymans S7.3]|uniref:Uncharacterized protein n=2 Tax=Serpula lacrymans var. lacrymans TaxID=341189 RepID=F8QC41_SERL3|nr:uncharacterized protein SERLADRAFT_443058 [Serpula lacrymans var. lacrymans S7.9]EGN94160.1 hypothetical protein SERLA73DRAFT_78080 [Serpula lacrymans var. lacrymans S7.3]EGO19588.1 hypothetical protein SERLADRAFT_443058 [Serpula lacrymans var. lacrymans S7.9]
MTYLWSGIACTLRTRIEGRLLAKDPVRNPSNTFTVHETKSAAEALLQRDCFDTNPAYSDNEDNKSDSTDHDNDTESSDSESSESEGDTGSHKQQLKKLEKKTEKLAKKKSKRITKDSDDKDTSVNLFS